MYASFKHPIHHLTGVTNPIPQHRNLGLTLWAVTLMMDLAALAPTRRY
jgi:hypothetical protein